MKAALVMDPLFVRKLNMSDATLAELAEAVVAGDKLYDPASRLEYEVVARGFPPARSEATAERVVWSRETVAGFSGRCAELNGRLLVDTSSPGDVWSFLSCLIQEKSGRLPIGIPIVGTIGPEMSSGYGVGVIREDGVTLMIAGATNSQLMTGDAFDFHCQSPLGTVVNARFLIKRHQSLPITGPILMWNKQDSECTLI